LNPTVLQWSELQSLDEDRFVGAQTRNVITGQVVVVSGLPLSEPTRSISVPGDRAEGKICYVKDQNRTACEISVKWKIYARQRSTTEVADLWGKVSLKKPPLLVGERAHWNPKRKA